MRLTAVLDTCVLVPSLQRDLLLETAFHGAYQPLWSDVTEVELVRVLGDLARAKGRDHASVYSLVPAMNAAFPHSRLDTARIVEFRCGLPDVDDEHVVRAAMLGEADMIVTWNRKDFPEVIVRPYAAVYDPDTFMLHLWRQNRRQVCKTLRVIAGRSGRYGRHMSVDDVITSLADDLPLFSASLRGDA